MERITFPVPLVCKRMPTDELPRARFVVSSSNPDASRDIVTPEALKSVTGSRVALLHHDRTQIAGTWTDFAVNADGELEADLVPAPGTPAGDELIGHLKAGTPLQASVGFKGAGTPNSLGGLTYGPRDFDLKEVSVVAIGANGDTRRIKAEEEEACILARARARAALALLNREGK